jgi:hypothetical protein
MATTSTKESTQQVIRSPLPADMLAIPVSAGQAIAPLKICVVVRLPSVTGESAAAPQLIVLRDTLEARVLLGCTVDAGQNLHEWLEVWVQSPENAASAPVAVRGVVTNAILDDRWAQLVGSLETVDANSVIRTGWEARPPAPVWLDATAKQPVHPKDTETGDLWMLCRDEAALAGAGLPPYGSTLHRYLYLPKRAAASIFVPVTADAPVGPRTKPLSALTGSRTDMPLLNPGGLMFVRSFSPLTLETFLEVLSAKPNSSLTPGPPLPPAPPSASAGPWAEHGWMLLGQHGRRGRLLESFHLRLRAFSDAVHAVRTVVSRTQRPLLNLDIDHFRVRLGDKASALPFLWSGRVALSDPGAAVDMAIPGSDERYCHAAGPPGAAVYQPVKSVQPTSGRGMVRVRKILPGASGTVVLEGTLSSQDRVDANPNDLLWLRFSDSNGPVDLYARISYEPGLPPGESRFRTIEQAIGNDRVQYFKSIEGIATPCGFHLLPVLSTACDLYSLAVLAVRMFLVNGESPLPVALDEVLSFARNVAQNRDSSASLRLRIGALFESDPRWPAALGPHRLSWEKLAHEQVRDLIPHDLWLGVLAMIVPMFPGIGPDSTCSDLSSSPPGAPQRVFDQLRSDLEFLILKTRSLIVVDWRFNREVSALIRSEIARLGAPTAMVNRESLLSATSWSL